MADSTAQGEPTFYVQMSGKDLSGARFEVGTDGLLVGRSPTCDVMIQDGEVSRRHAYFYPADRFCYVKDLGARNGILVNGRREKEKRLADGDVVDIGPARFVLSVEGAVPEGAAARARDDREQRPSVLGTPEGPEAGRHPLAIASLVFGVLTYLHWAFGFSAMGLALLVLWEIRREHGRTGRALAFAGLLLGLVGGVLNAWFAEAAPRLREPRERAARMACRDNLSAIAAALRAYRSTYHGAHPKQLDSLLAEGLLERRSLQCPGARLEGKKQRDYLFFGGGAVALGSRFDIVACDPDLACHQNRGGWVLRGDGRAQWMAPEPFCRLVDELNLNRQALGARDTAGGRP